MIILSKNFIIVYILHEFFILYSLIFIKLNRYIIYKYYKFAELLLHHIVNYVYLPQLLLVLIQEATLYSFIINFYYILS